MPSHDAIAVAALTLAVTACSTSSTGDVRPPPSPVRSGPVASSTPRAAEAPAKLDPTRSAPADAEVAAAVRSGLGSGLGDVEVLVQRGIVSLRGTAPHLLAKDHATRVAEGTRGVRAVSNQLVVELVARTDQEIAADLMDALRSDPATQATDIDVEVESGAVTLRGTVDFSAEREVVERTAKSIRGVREVEDLLVVLRQTDRPHREVPAEEIAQAVVDVMRIDPRVDHQAIDVTVAGSAVRLSGAVADERTRSVAGDLARDTVGVSAVGNDIIVTASRVTDADDVIAPPGLAPPPSAPADSAILARIRDNLVWSGIVEAEDVRVNVIEGAATLTGRVGTWAEREAAVTAAYAGGATTVIDELRVGASQ